MKYLLTSLIMFLSVAIGNVFAQSNSVTLLEKSTNRWNFKCTRLDG